ncbi:MAG: ribonuclease HI family protein [Phycisphaeraceae bacterium]|nr:ribonuclease HI family protein [Phycisphaeraceae bacterium]
MDLLLNIDGGSRGNPGPAAAGVVLRDAASKALLRKCAYFLGDLTNNVAEYQALIRGLKLALTLKPQSLAIQGDSELLVRQITGRYKVKSPDLIPLHEQATQLLAQFPKWTIQHVLRDQNQLADELVNHCLDLGKNLDSAAKGFVDSAPSSPLRSSPDSPVSPPDHCWTLRFQTAPDKNCPARPRPGQSFTFSTVTPAGLCIHAAQAALEIYLASLDLPSPPGGHGTSASPSQSSPPLPKSSPAASEKVSSPLPSSDDPLAGHVFRCGRCGARLCLAPRTLS